MALRAEAERAGPPERALAADRDRGQLSALAVSKQGVGLALQDVAEDLATVECRGADHGCRRNHDLVDAELVQLLDRRAPDDAAHSRPDHRAHAHRAGLAGGIEDRLIPAAIAV